MKAAYHTLGCKVNQYDTEAMRELFEQAGYETVPFEAEADVYVINTCTVTGVGDKKSLQMIRRCAREHPASGIIVTGCLAQRSPEKVKLPGVRLILGTQRRGEVVELYEAAVREDVQRVAVDSLKAARFESLAITSLSEHVRAYMKIQEGCNRYCSYCIIPYVRGPIRSRAIADIRAEAERLAAAGYREIVLTGIHLTSYGQDLRDGTQLTDAIRAVHEVPGIRRIRLGSLEPVIVTEAFVRELEAMPKVCRQFHLALQSGSDAILARMRRRYTAAEFLAACDLLRSAFPDCALTTDIVTGFPGETQEDFEETERVCAAVGFSRMHVFPYSEREGTAAATMDGALPRAVREARAVQLIRLGKQLEEHALRVFAGRAVEILVERTENGVSTGYTGAYMRASLPGDYREGTLVGARVTGIQQGGLLCEPLDKQEEER